MSPELAQRLIANPDFKEFVSFLADEALKLNILSDITLTDPVEIAVQVMARQLAYKRIIEILHPFVDAQVVSPGQPTSADYAM